MQFAANSSFLSLDTVLDGKGMLKCNRIPTFIYFAKFETSTRNILFSLWTIYFMDSLPAILDDFIL